jgi:hypothetical protein
VNIYQRINAVMQAVKYVQKDATVERYKAVSHDQVVSVAREELVKAGIVVYPEQSSGSVVEVMQTKSGGRMALYSGDYTVHFVNIEDPTDRISVPVQAHAMDNGDKAPGKAVTYATKTALLKVLCLETGENDESRAEIRELSQPVTDEQAETLKSLLAETESDTAKFLNTVSKAKGLGSVASVDDLPRSAYEFAHGALLKKREQQARAA